MTYCCTSLLYMRQGHDPLLQIMPPDLGRGGGIRTHDLFVPNEARYQAAPHPATIAEST